jgi:hypothetical protein
VKTLHWPKRHPYNKRWFQRQVAIQMTTERHARVLAIYRKWEPRMWRARLNVPECLVKELIYLSTSVDCGAIDWRPFPGWVREVHHREH